MSLVELMVGIAAGALVLIVVAKLTIFTARSFVALGNYNDLDKASVIAVDTMTRDIRQTISVSGYQSNRLVFVNYDGTQLTYLWSPTTHNLTRNRAGQIKTLLTQCDYLNFAVYQRNPTNNFSFVGTTNLSQIKLIDVNWRCSRPILQQKVTTESVQTARIVIRN